MNSNETYTYNVTTNFSAASIYKIPLAMIYYELIDEKQYSLSDALLYQEHHYEAGGPIGDSYMVNSYINLQSLLEYMIIYSDNTAAHILFENLGGWIEFKKLITKYSDMAYTDDFYSYENVFKANYLNDLLNYLYKNKTKFQALISNMQIPTGYDYLSQYVDCTISQKYGYYDTAVNSIGIVYSKIPYSIVILTSLGENGSKHIGKINKICYDHFQT